MAILLTDNTKKEEPLDRNKTELTHKLTALAVGHLTVIGCKPIETEVPVGEGIIVDVAGFTYPSMSELKRGKLLKSAIMEEPILKGHSDYFTEEYISRKRLYPLTAVVEVKITVADFKKDIQRKFLLPIADLNYIIVPNSIYETCHELLQKGQIGNMSYWNWNTWSFIVASDNGERILKSDIPKINTIPIDKTLSIVSQIAIRRCHRTEYAFMRNMLKQYRVKKKEEDIRCKILEQKLEENNDE